MILYNETNYVNGKSQFLSADGNPVQNGSVRVLFSGSEISHFSLDSAGFGTPSIESGKTYSFEVLDSSGNVVNTLFPVMLGDFGGGGGGEGGDVATERAERIAADNALQSQIDGKADKGSFDDELNALRNKDAELQNKINSNQYRMESALADETSAREAADTQLQSNIDAETARAEAAESALDTRLTTAESDIDALQQGLADEIEDRGEADRDLQSQIDAISSKSDVVDVVASYVELLAYDTSELGDNDVIKVLRDEMQDDAESYYRWHIVTSTWSLIGTQGPFVTPSEMQTALNGKVDKVTGKGLSTNDYTTAEKTKLAGIASGAEVNVNADWNAISGDAQILNKPSTFPPSSHTHGIGDVTGLQDELNGKQYFTRTKSKISTALSSINTTNYLRCSYFFESTKNIGSYTSGNSIILILYDVSSFTNDGLQNSGDWCFFRGFANLGYVAGLGYESISKVVAGIHYNSSNRELNSDDNLVRSMIVTAKYDDTANGIITGHRYLAIHINHTQRSYGNKEFLIEGVFGSKISNASYYHKGFIGLNYFYGSATETYWDTYAGTQSFVGNVATANKLFTSRELAVDLSNTSTTTKFDGGANVTNIKISNTLPITNGGTGKATANDAANALINGLPLWSADVTDSTQIIRQDTGGTANFGRVPGSSMWNYIKSKISSVLGLTATNYGGTAAKATADASGKTITSTYALKSEIPDVSGKEDTSNKVTTLDNSTTHYPSTSAVTTALNGKANANGSNASGDWAISATKGRIVSRTDFDALVTTGTYEILLEAEEELTNSNHPPTEGTTASTCRGFIEVRNVGGTTNLVLQQATYNAGYIVTRRRLNNSWTSWERMTYIPNGTAVGSPTQPVYVDVQGAVQACTGSNIAATSNQNITPTKAQLEANQYFLYRNNNATTYNLNIDADLLVDGKVYSITLVGDSSVTPNRTWNVRFKSSGGVANTYSDYASYSVSTGTLTTSFQNVEKSTTWRNKQVVRKGSSVYIFGY